MSKRAEESATCYSKRVMGCDMDWVSVEKLGLRLNTRECVLDLCYR